MEIRPGSGSSSTATAMSETGMQMLARLQRMHGEQVQARVLSSDSQSRVTLQIGAGAAAATAGAAAGTQTVQVEKPPNLPAHLLATGQWVNLRIIPGRGLLLISQHPTTTPDPPVTQPSAAQRESYQGLQRTLARWLPLQDDLVGSLRQIAVQQHQPTATDAVRQQLLNALPAQSALQGNDRLSAAIRQVLQPVEKSLLAALRQAQGQGAGLIHTAQTSRVQAAENLLGLLEARVNSRGQPGPTGSVETSGRSQQLSAALGILQQRVMDRLQLWAQQFDSRSKPGAISDLGAAKSPANEIPGVIQGPRGSSHPIPAAPGWLPASELKSLTLSILLNQIRQGGTSAQAVLQPLSQTLPQTLTSDSSALLTQPLRFPFRPDSSLRPPPVADDLFQSLLKILGRLHVQQLNAAATQLAAATADPLAQSTPLVWLAELPYKAQDIESIQIHIEQAPEHSHEPDPKKAQWKVVLSFDFPQFGAFQARMQLRGSQLQLTWYAESPKALRLLNQHLTTLREGLVQWGLQIDRLEVRRGNPPMPQAPIQRSMIDERV